MSQDSTNYRMDCRKRGKRWCATVFPDEEYTNDMERMFNDWKEKRLDEPEVGYSISYICMGREMAPSTNKIHFQCYMEFYKTVSLAYLKRKFSNKAHFEIARGGKYDNIKYCSKEKDTEHGMFLDFSRLEFNEEKLREKVDAQKLQFFQDCRKYTMQELEEFYPNSVFNQRGKIQEWRMYGVQKKTYSGSLNHKNYWIYGPTGVGKSRWVREQGKTIYEKNVNKWWNGYDFQEIVLVEDFPIGDKARMMFDYVKLWADRYNFVGELKNSHMNICPDTYKLIITANHSIDETFADIPDEDRRAIKRRFNEVYIADENDIFLNTRI